MDVIPAIDLMSGKCVRLIQGEYHRQISYEDDPVKQAQKFLEAGAKHLHIVDLDGARVGKPINIEAVKNIMTVQGLQVEIGGGIRDEASIRTMLDIGISRVIIGTSAVKKFDWFIEMANKFPGKLVLGIDARGSKIAIQGWTQDGPHQLWEFAAQAANLPIAAIIYTDISKDGMMAGPNFERTKSLVDVSDVPIIAAGGVTEIADVTKFMELGVAGVIVGRALYEGKMDLAEAVKVARSQQE
jgi:phosphoribosylformimino-5-aminoimidazole carboxamide ribotide isomerase